MQPKDRPLILIASQGTLGVQQFTRQEMTRIGTCTSMGFRAFSCSCHAHRGKEKMKQKKAVEGLMERRGLLFSYSWHLCIEPEQQLDSCISYNGHVCIGHEQQ
eukprot:scaffold171318_cov20-Tisochrysis_lutea.AAC.1